jgi:hypothetical protein
VFANSLPKAGTHLLMALLDAVPSVSFSGRHFAFGLTTDEHAEVERLDSLRREMARVRSSQYMTAHVPYSIERAQLLREAEMRSVLVLRDPRDVVVSLAMYIENNPRHHLHDRFLAEYPDRDARLKAVISGVPPCDGSRGLVSLGDRVRRYLGWIDDPQTCTIRYEELLGPRGGGSRAAQLATVRKVMSHLELSEQAFPIEPIADAIYSTRSATFRTGRIGDWRATLTPDHDALMGSGWRDLLHRMGYA